MDDNERRLLENEKLLDEHRLQISRLVSDAESEKGSRDRAHKELRQDRKDLDEKYHKIIYGNNGNVGIDKRLDRVEQRIGDIKYLWGIVIGMGATVVSALFVHFFTK